MGSLRVRPERGGVALALLDAEGERGHVLRLDLDGDAEPRGEDHVGDVFHYLFGRDPDACHRKVPGFDSVTYDEAWPGTRLSLEGVAAALEFDAHVTSGQLAFDLEGFESLEVRGDGSLAVRTTVGNVVLSAPRVLRAGPSPDGPAAASAALHIEVQPAP